MEGAKKRMIDLEQLLDNIHKEKKSCFLKTHRNFESKTNPLSFSVV